MRATTTSSAGEARAPTAAPPSPAHQRAAFAFLMEGFAAQRQAARTGGAAQWLWLEAAHVLGQRTLALHWRSHAAMLRHALALRDAREAAGQVLRLALVPLGHALRRLPAGNIGRATVPALRPMEPPAAVAALVAHALQHTRPPGDVR